MPRTKNLSLLLIALFATTVQAELTITVLSSSKSGAKTKNLGRAAAPASTTKQEEADEFEMPAAGVSRYGKGQTLASRQQSQQDRVKTDSVQDKTGTATIRRETHIDETRSRTYYEIEPTSVSIGAQRQQSIVRQKIATSYESPAARVGGIEVARVRSESSTEAFVGTQADVAGSIDLGADPKVEVKAGVFVGARVDTKSTAAVEVLGASASTTAEGSASVGAEAAVGSEVSGEGAEVGASAFAGARAEGSVSGEVGGVGAAASGEAWAGIGAEAKGTAKFEDGKLTFGTEAGAAVGVGGKVGYSATIDVEKLHHDGTALVRNTGKLASRARNTVPKVNSELRRSVASQFTPAAAAVVGTSANQLQRTTNSAGRTARNTANRLAKSKDAAHKKAHEATRKAASDTKRTVKKTTKKVTQKSKRTTRKISKAAKGLLGR